MLVIKIVNCEFSKLFTNGASSYAVVARTLGQRGRSRGVVNKVSLDLLSINEILFEDGTVEEN